MVRRLGPWKDQAACLDADPRLFFAHQTQPDQRAQARAICHGCPVREECLAYAIDAREDHGIWGGLDERERRRLREAARRLAARRIPR